MRAVLLVALFLAVPATALTLAPTASACKIGDCLPAGECDGFGCEVCVPDGDCYFVKFPCTTDRCF